MLKFGSDIGIDLGTANVVVYIKNRGIVLNEPSVVAVDRKSGKIMAVGEEAKGMLGRTPENIEVIRPLKYGVISDYAVTLRMLRYFINETCGKRRFFRPRIMVCVPSGVTEVERKAAKDASSAAGGSKIFIIEEPIAAAIGAGIDIYEPMGNMVVDIGGGTTDIAVISLGDVVESRSIKVAGDEFNQAIVRYMRKEYNVLIGDRTAEEIKMEIGSVHRGGINRQMDCRGRDLVTGLPKNIVITTLDMIAALEECALSITEAIHSVLEKTPPELAADISKSGIILTGGGALTDGMDRIIKEETGVDTFIAENALESVAIGTGLSLQNIGFKRKTII